MDCDLESAWPTFGVSVCKKHGVPVPAFAAYVKDTDGIRRVLAAHYGVTTKQAKLLPLRILMGGGEGMKQWARLQAQDSEARKNGEA